MFADVSYIVRFYKPDGAYSDEVWHETEQAARDHMNLFTDADGYGAIEIVKYDWIKRKETQVDAVTF